MIDHAPSPSPPASRGSPSREATAPPPSCYAPWVFMEIHDLFGDKSPDGNLVRVGCLHERDADGICRSGEQPPGTSCLRRNPTRRQVRVTEGDRLPRAQIRDILQAGDEPVLEFASHSRPNERILLETAHLLHKLRNTGINVTVAGLSVAEKSRLARMEWKS